MDQLPPPEIARELITLSLSIPDVRFEQSRMAFPETLALWLPDRLARGPADAFIDGHEFCHIQPPPEVSIHATLPEPLRERAVELGWAEPHPVTGCGIMPALVMVYAPRDLHELEIVLSLIRSSWEFARGGAIQADVRG